MTRTQSQILTILLCHVRDMLSLAVRYYAVPSIDVTMAGMRVVVRQIPGPWPTRDGAGYAAYLLVGADIALDDDQPGLMRMCAYAYGQHADVTQAFAEMQDNLNTRRTEAGLFAVPSMDERVRDMLAGDRTAL